MFGRLFVQLFIYEMSIGTLNFVSYHPQTTIAILIDNQVRVDSELFELLDCKTKERLLYLKRREITLLHDITMDTN